MAILTVAGWYAAVVGLKKNGSGGAAAGIMLRCVGPSKGIFIYDVGEIVGKAGWVGLMGANAG